MLNDRLKTAIKDSGIKVDHIAKQLGWHPTKVSQITHGHRAPTKSDKKELARFLKKRVRDLFDQ